MALQALAGSMLRAAALPMMRGLAFRGVTNISLAQRIVRNTLGAAPRTSTFFNDYRGFLRIAEQAARIKFIPKKFQIPRARHIEQEWVAPENYRYIVRLQGRNTVTGESVEFYRTSYSRGRMQVGNIEEGTRKAYWSRGKLTKYGQEEFGDFELTSVNVISAFHKEGARW